MEAPNGSERAGQQIRFVQSTTDLRNALNELLNCLSACSDASVDVSSGLNPPELSKAAIEGAGTRDAASVVRRLSSLLLACSSLSRQTSNKPVLISPSGGKNGTRGSGYALAIRLQRRLFNAVGVDNELMTQCLHEVSQYCKPLDKSQPTALVAANAGLVLIVGKLLRPLVARVIAHSYDYQAAASITRIEAECEQKRKDVYVSIGARVEDLPLRMRRLALLFGTYKSIDELPIPTLVKRGKDGARRWTAIELAGLCAVVTQRLWDDAQTLDGMIREWYQHYGRAAVCSQFERTTYAHLAEDVSMEDPVDAGRKSLKAFIASRFPGPGESKREQHSPGSSPLEAHLLRMHYDCVSAEYLTRLGQGESDPGIDITKDNAVFHLLRTPGYAIMARAAATSGAESAWTELKAATDPRSRFVADYQQKIGHAADAARRFSAILNDGALECEARTESYLFAPLRVNERHLHQIIRAVGLLRELCIPFSNERIHTDSVRGVIDSLGYIASLVGEAAAHGLMGDWGLEELGVRIEK